MNYLESMRAGKSKEQVAFLEFMLHTDKGIIGLFCFFEGRDRPYYEHRIQQFIPLEQIHSIPCGGRDKVLKVHRLISNHSEYQRYKKAFFIDRDFNPPLATNYDPPIFETPCYSIENLYVSENSFKLILKGILALSEVSQAYEDAISLFIARRTEFHEAVLLFNAWYACLMDIRNATGQKIEGLQLEDKLPDGFIKFSLESIECKYDLTKIKNKKKFSKAPELDANTLEQKMQEFRNCDKGMRFRGKYELQFMVRLIDLIIEDAGSKERKTIFKKKIQFPYGGLNNEMAIVLFSAYAQTPTTLKDYLSRVTA